ncbi:E3 ubiquitin ligase PQT3-like [Hevea brasiliensis]|uniref:E3 ubiquitin ligase PQT3-like n=1 Tax=Hevea brasiliensis TaxID=3981 RepID=UPI0025DF2855|nr:E3 ubiquitin ligase PQT3-like [Hevea brasiliensis]
MPIYFKFFSAKEYDSISVDGSVISVDALKRKIFEYKYKSNMKSHSNGLCFGTDLDLVVINAQTNDCYVDDMLIPNNTRVLIRRIPGTRRGKPIDTATIVVIEKQQPLSSFYRTGSSNTETVVTASSRSTPVNAGVSSVSASTITSLSSTKCSGDASFGYDDGFGDDVFVIPRMKPAQSSMTSVDVESDEDSKIKALVNTPALDWQLEGSIGVGSRTQGVNRRGCGRMDGHSFGGLRKKTPPEGYICHRCKVPGHFIQYCRTNGDPNYDFKRVRPPTGIPKSMLVTNADGSYVLSSGETAVLQPNDDAFRKEIFGCFPSKRSWSVSDLPPELLCPLCKQIMKDAVLTSKCCFKSFCDKCIRDHLIISKLKCVCGAANVLADSLIPNMTLRDTINCFVESSCSNSRSGENAKINSFRVMDVESAHCSQPQISTTKLPAGSFQEAKKTTLDNIEDEANKRKLLDDPYQIAKKPRTTRAADVSEATIGSTRMKDTASQGSVLVVEEEVQEEVVSSEGGKNRNVAEDEVQQNLVFSKGGKKKRGIKNSQDDSHSLLMPVGSYAYNPYWAGVQVGVEEYVAPYYAARAMNYGLSLCGTTFNGKMNQASFSMQQMCGRQ